jgi:hypothetical protein
MASKRTPPDRPLKHKMWQYLISTATLPMSDYPATVSEVLDPPVRSRAATVEAVHRFAAARPWRGSQDERIGKFQTVHADLCRIYGKGTRLRFGPLDGGSSGSSFYNQGLDVIELRGKLSVVTYLHEFVHALGRDERGACRWSLSLFRKCFPQHFSGCRADAHMLRA